MSGRSPRSGSAVSLSARARARQLSASEPQGAALGRRMCGQCPLAPLVRHPRIPRGRGQRRAAEARRGMRAVARVPSPSRGSFAAVTGDSTPRFGSEPSDLSTAVHAVEVLAPIAPGLTAAAADTPATLVPVASGIQAKIDRCLRPDWLVAHHQGGQALDFGRFHVGEHHPGFVGRVGAVSEGRHQTTSPQTRIGLSPRGRTSTPAIARLGAGRPRRRASHPS